MCTSNFYTIYYLLFPEGKHCWSTICDSLYLAWGLYTRDIATEKPHSPDMGNSKLRSNMSDSNILGLW